MYIVVDLDVVLCIPHGHSCDEVRFGLCCQFQVPFNMVLNDWEPLHSKDTSVEHVGIHRQLTSYWIQRKFTSLMKSSCFLSSASIARSSMPPGVALSLWQNRSFWISNSKSLSADNVQLLTISSTFQENVTVLITAWRRKKCPSLPHFKKKRCPTWIELTYDRWRSEW